MKAVSLNLDLDVNAALRPDFHTNGLGFGHGFRADWPHYCKMNLFSDIGKVSIHSHDNFYNIVNFP